MMKLTFMKHMMSELRVYNRTQPVTVFDRHLGVL